MSGAGLKQWTQEKITRYVRGDILSCVLVQSSEPSYSRAGNTPAVTCRMLESDPARVSRFVMYACEIRFFFQRLARILSLTVWSWNCDVPTL